MRLLSVLAEALALVDIFEDLPEDLAQGRCYLPRADLRRLGLEIAHLGSGKGSEALDELVRLQVGRGRELLAQAALVTQMVGAEFRMGVQALVGGRLRFDEIEILRSRVLAEGLDPMLPAGAARIRPLPLNAGPAPGHVAVIMDGNRRWAEQRGLPALEGHRSGELALGHLIYSALRLGIRHLSVYAFSTENWNRSLEELAPLFDTMAGFLTESVERLQRLGVQVRWCGQRDRFDPSIASALALLESMTSNNSALMLTICADYGGREELAAAARALAAEVVAGTVRPEDIGPADLARHLYVPELPDVDLLIRTSGEQRISNFLPWQLAYAELVFDPVLWPDFGLSQLYNAVAVYAGRQRRFGADLPGRARPAKLARTG
ncbi:polyprenyl diphosphate synthase [Streptomyces sp. NPDC001410]|uniref:polyprenyl diphosphate synthase n=1 Tax=Streptomyces sp. NPDC001410 TaxID=3364574 RepID=UPI0036CB4B50